MIPIIPWAKDMPAVLAQMEKRRAGEPEVKTKRKKKQKHADPKKVKLTKQLQKKEHKIVGSESDHYKSLFHTTKKQVFAA